MDYRPRIPSVWDAYGLLARAVAIFDQHGAAVETEGPPVVPQPGKSTK